ncbi:MAG TPA: BrnT family toxin [Thermoanaerobaculia bacterium]|nr:BrnT family toxin [Thermoanaerobaculia bacterium]
MSEFEWDDRKARANLRDHGIDFADAVSALEDRLLVVVHTWRGDRIRLISARKATARERRAYGIMR